MFPAIVQSQEAMRGSSQSTVCGIQTKGGGSLWEQPMISSSKSKGNDLPLYCQRVILVTGLLMSPSIFPHRKECEWDIRGQNLVSTFPNWLLLCYKFWQTFCLLTYIHVQVCPTEKCHPRILWPASLFLFHNLFNLMSLPPLTFYLSFLTWSLLVFMS